MRFMDENEDETGRVKSEATKTNLIFKINFIFIYI